MDGRLISSLMERYGQRVVLWTGADKTEVRAFFQAVRDREAGETVTPVGVAPAGKYLYLGPAAASLEGVDALEWGGRRFALWNVRDICLGDTVTHRWALAVEMDGEAAK